MQNLRLYIGAVIITIFLALSAVISPGGQSQRLASGDVSSPAPVFSSVPSQQLAVNQSFALTVTVADAGSQDLRMSIMQGPNWVALTNCTAEADLSQLQCQLEGTSPTEPGIYTVLVQATTGDGRSNSQVLTINVS